MHCTALGVIENRSIQTIGRAFRVSHLSSTDGWPDQHELRELLTTRQEAQPTHLTCYSPTSQSLNAPAALEHDMSCLIPTTTLKTV